MDLLLTLSLIATVTALTGLGVVVLPWTDAELEGSADAARALGEGVVRGGAVRIRGGIRAAQPVEATVPARA